MGRVLEDLPVLVQEGYEEARCHPPIFEEADRVTILFYRWIEAATHSRCFHEQSFFNQQARGNVSPATCCFSPRAEAEGAEAAGTAPPAASIQQLSCCYTAQPCVAELAAAAAAAAAVAEAAAELRS